MFVQWRVDDSTCFISPIWPWSKWSKPTSVVWTEMSTPLTFMTEDIDI